MRLPTLPTLSPVSRPPKSTLRPPANCPHSGPGHSLAQGLPPAPAPLPVVREAPGHTAPSSLVRPEGPTHPAPAATCFLWSECASLPLPDLQASAHTCASPCWVLGTTSQSALVVAPGDALRGTGSLDICCSRARTSGAHLGRHSFARKERGPLVRGHFVVHAPKSVLKRGLCLRWLLPPTFSLRVAPSPPHPLSRSACVSPAVTRACLTVPKAHWCLFPVSPCQGLGCPPP